MKKVLTSDQMREVDRLTTKNYGIESIRLMENAARAVAQVVTAKLGGSVKGRSILILCGKGNNGGDGAALSRLLSIDKAKVEVYLFGKVADTRGDARDNFERLIALSSGDRENKGELYFEEVLSLDEWVKNTGFENVDFDVIVDALFGTGLTRPLDESYGFISKVFNEKIRSVRVSKMDSPFVISVDIPSGLYSDNSDKPEIHFESDLTVTFTSPKAANVLAPAYRFNGELVVVDIGSPQKLIDEQHSNLYLAENRDAKDWLEKSTFSPDSYKNKRGHTVVIAGSENYSGAAVLCANAAMRSGVGLVTVVTPRSSKDLISARILPEVMVRGVAATASGAIDEAAYGEIQDLLEKVDSIAIGCGLDQDESTKKFVQNVVKHRRQPMIVDADALNLLSPFNGDAASSDKKFPLILTPHEGEFRRLMGTNDEDAFKDRVAAVRKFASTHNVILVLKGERVLIGESGGKVLVNPTGNAGLGKAGNGDTLAGILAGFVAQSASINIDMFETVAAAVYLGGLAGEIAESKYGKRVMTASDVRECLTEAFAFVENS